MPTLIGNRTKTGHGFSPMKQGWGQEVAHKYPHIEAEDAFYLGGEEDIPVGILTSGMRRRIEDFTKHAALIVENWDYWHHPKGRRKPQINASENLRHRLANANSYFRRKASAVFGDRTALTLLESLYEDVVVDISDFDTCEKGISLAKLTAANFCEVGANVIHITEAGQQFIDSLRSHGRI